MPLDFSHEQWVRLYKRDTLTMKLLSWQARSLFWAMLRKADRSGIIEVRGLGAKGLATVVDMPRDVVELAIAELLDTETCKYTGNSYVLPRFIEAQEAPMSATARQRTFREKRRDSELAINSTVPVTFRNETLCEGNETLCEGNETLCEDNETLPMSLHPLHSVTKSNYKKRKETKRQDKTSKESKAPSARAPAKPAAHLFSGDDFDFEAQGAETLSKGSVAGRRQADPVAARLWAEQERLRAEINPNARGLKPTPERLKLITQRLKAGATEEECKIVLQQYADEAKRNPESAKWLNGVTNWREDNFNRTLGAAGAITKRETKSAAQSIWDDAMALEAQGL